jgi:hypothetical protein
VSDVISGGSVVAMVTVVTRQSRALVNNNMNRCCDFRKQKCDQERSRENYTELTKEILRMWNLKNKSDMVYK